MTDPGMTDMDTRQDDGAPTGSAASTSAEPYTTMPIPVHTGTPTPPRRLLRGAEQLAHLIGARLLVGITFRDSRGSVVRADQFCGRVLEVGEGVVVVERGREPVVLPADAGAYEVARPGRYVLQSTGETVVDPDYLTVWDVQVDD